MDVILIAPKEISLRDKTLFRENDVKNDFCNITENSINFMYVKFLKDNLGIASLAAYLRKSGYTAKLINSYLNDISIEELCDMVLEENPKIVGISLLYDLHSYSTCKLVKLLRKKGYKGHITLGGPFITLTYEYFLLGLKEIDSVIRGEGEITLLTLLEKLNSKENWHDIKGLAYKSGKNVIVNGEGNYERDLSILPVVARDLYSELVEKLKNNKTKIRVASIFTSRGCGGRCTYCSAPVLGNLVTEKWRCRTVESVVKEIQYLVNTFGIEYINIIDENFYGYGEKGKKRLYEFANAIIDLNLKVKFWVEIRVDTELDEDLFKLLRKAGLQDILLGLESGSQSTLNRWRKGTTVEQNKKSIEFIRKCGFNLEPALIMVDPYTNLKEFKETVNFIEETRLFNTKQPLYFFNQLIVFPGTEIERQLLKDKIITRLDPYEIKEITSDSEEIMQFCRNVSSRNYEIIDPVIRYVWECLVFFTNKLSFILDEFIPLFIRFYKEISYQNGIGNSKYDKEAYIEFITKIGKWRRNIGNLVMNILKESVHCAEENFVSNEELKCNLHKSLYNVIDLYNKQCLGEKIENFLTRNISESGFYYCKDIEFLNFFNY